MAKTSPGTVMLTPTVPTPLAALYAATQAERAQAQPPLPPLPIISHLLAAAMRAELLSRGIPSSHPALLPPTPSRTTSATQARSRARLERSQPAEAAPAEPSSPALEPIPCASCSRQRFAPHPEPQEGETLGQWRLRTGQPGHGTPAASAERWVGGRWQAEPPEG